MDPSQKTIQLGLMRTFLRPLQGRGLAWFVCFTLCIFVLAFVLTELSFILSLVLNNMPISLLYEQFTAFLANETVYPVGHFILIAILGGMYINLLRYTFIERRFFSRKSFLTSSLGVLGVSIGLSCISCGTAALIILLSFLGASGSLALLSSTQPYILLLGELALALSIFLAVTSLKRLGV